MLPLVFGVNRKVFRSRDFWNMVCGMTNDTPHPLEAWLADQGKTIFTWGPANGISKTTLYHMVGGREPSVRTLAAIERKTLGEVSMRSCFDWWQARQPEEGTE